MTGVSRIAFRESEVQQHDLLPEAQGQGWGRRLIEALLDELAARGATGVHLEMDPANEAAGAFYARLGFSRLVADEDTARFAMRLPREART